METLINLKHLIEYRCTIYLVIQDILSTSVRHTFTEHLGCARPCQRDPKINRMTAWVGCPRTTKGQQRFSKKDQKVNRLKLHGQFSIFVANTLSFACLLACLFCHPLEMWNLPFWRRWPYRNSPWVSFGSGDINCQPWSRRLIKKKQLEHKGCWNWGLYRCCCLLSDVILTEKACKLASRISYHF